MINLDVKGYCEDCPYFDPDVSKDIHYRDPGPERADSVITCTHSHACEWAISHCFGNNGGDKNE